MGRRNRRVSETESGLLRSVGLGLSPGCLSSPAGATLLQLVHKPASPHAMLLRAPTLYGFPALNYSNQNALSLALRAAAARRRHSLVLC
jgi:hypothetical protein